MVLGQVRRWTALLATAIAAATAVGVAAPTPAAAATSTASMESQFVAKVNAARAAAGLPAYSVSYDLVGVAREHSAEMASRQELYHNPTLATDVHGWEAVGENVGEGPSVGSLHNAFMQSPEHRANILDHDFTQIGVGVTVDHDGTIWVTEDFRQPMSTPVRHARHRSGTSVAPAVAAAAPVAAPAVITPSPRAVLRHRLVQLRRQPPRSGADPVAQSLAYAAALSRLAG